jgi:hypothetical protein
MTPAEQTHATIDEDAADAPHAAAEAPHAAAPVPEAGAHAAAAAITPADTTEAARLVAHGLQPKQLPARDADYAALVRRYREDPPFARLADAVATGLGLIVLEVSPRTGMALSAYEDSVFSVRLGEYSRRAVSDTGDRFLHGLAHLSVPPSPSPVPRTWSTTATSAGSP